MKPLFIFLGHIIATSIIFFIGDKLGYSGITTGLIFWIGVSYGHYQERTPGQ